MPLDLSSATDLRIHQEHGELLIAWTGSAPAGHWYQVYLDGQLAWWGPDQRARAPAPVAGQEVQVDVGSVPPGEQRQSFAADLSFPVTRPVLRWRGGRSQATGGDLAGFRVYGEPSPGAGVSYASPVGWVSAAEARRFADGWGSGGWGSGGWGAGDLEYTWVGPHYRRGAWQFAVVPVSGQGVEGPGSAVAVSVHAAPRDSPPLPDGCRLHAVDDGTEITLTFFPSPDEA